MAKAKSSGRDGDLKITAEPVGDFKGDGPRPKKAKPGKSAGEAPANSTGEAIGKTKAKSRAQKAGRKSYETLVKLADHPLVADLIAVGAMAAVAALAGDKDRAGAVASSTKKSVKAAGSAAAAAIGKRLLDEFSSAKKAAKKL